MRQKQRARETENERGPTHVTKENKKVGGGGVVGLRDKEEENAGEH